MKTDAGLTLAATPATKSTGDSSSIHHTPPASEFQVINWKYWFFLDLLHMMTSTVYLVAIGKIEPGVGCDNSFF